MLIDTTAVSCVLRAVLCAPCWLFANFYRLRVSPLIRTAVIAHRPGDFLADEAESSEARKWRLETKG